jgi:hypothetical protein
VDPARRGSDWLDGALAGWLMVSAAQAVDRGGAGRFVVALVLVGAVVPYLRGSRAGWALAAAGIALHLVGSLAGAEGGVRPLAALLPHLLALGYLAWVRPGFFAAASPAPPPTPVRPAPDELPPPAEAAPAEAAAGGARPVEPGVPLPAGEVCLAARGVELYRVPADHAGSAGDSLHPLRPPKDLAGHTRAGSCRFLVTDRRLVLVAPSGQQSPLPLARIAGAAAHANGVEVRPVRGPALFLRFDDGVGEVAAVLAGARRAAVTHPPSDLT